jgi:hypothetical protein
MERSGETHRLWSLDSYYAFQVVEARSLDHLRDRVIPHLFHGQVPEFYPTDMDYCILRTPERRVYMVCPPKPMVAVPNLAATRIFMDKLRFEPRPTSSTQPHHETLPYFIEQLPAGNVLFFQTSGDSETLLDYSRHQLTLDWPLFFFNDTPYMFLARDKKPRFNQYAHLVTSTQRLLHIVHEYLREKTFNNTMTASQRARAECTVFAACTYHVFQKEWRRLNDLRCGLYTWG